MNPLIRNKFSVVPRETLEFDSESDRCQQHFLESSKITNIYNRYLKTGIVENVSKVQKRFGNFMDLGQYAESLDKAAKAEQAFEQLPSRVRNRFGNNPKEFYRFVMNPKKNLEEGIELGIFERPAAPPPEKIQKVEVIEKTSSKKSE